MTDPVSLISPQESYVRIQSPPTNPTHSCYLGRERVSSQVLCQQLKCTLTHIAAFVLKSSYAQFQNRHLTSQWNGLGEGRENKCIDVAEVRGVAIIKCPHTLA